MKRPDYWIGLDAEGEQVTACETHRPEEVAWPSDVAYLVGPWHDCEAEDCPNPACATARFCSERCRENWLYYTDPDYQMMADTRAAGKAWRESQQP